MQSSRPLSRPPPAKTWRARRCPPPDQRTSRQVVALIARANPNKGTQAGAGPRRSQARAQSPMPSARRAEPGAAVSLVMSRTCSATSTSRQARVAPVLAQTEPVAPVEAEKSFWARARAAKDREHPAEAGLAERSAQVVAAVELAVLVREAAPYRERLYASLRPVRSMCP